MMRTFFQIVLALGKTERHDGVHQPGTVADADNLSVQPRRLALGCGPEFVGERIVNHAHDGLRAVLERNRNRGVWHSEKIIHRAVNRVNHPAIFGGHVAGAAFLAEHRNLRPRRREDFFDERLATHVELQLDVVGLGGVDVFGLMPVDMHDFSSGARGPHGGGQGGVQLNGFH
jgi:hypothetical protein